MPPKPGKKFTLTPPKKISEAKKVNLPPIVNKAVPVKPKAKVVSLPVRVVKKEVTIVPKQLNADEKRKSRPAATKVVEFEKKPSDDKKVWIECVNWKRNEFIVRGGFTFGELNKDVAKHSDVLAELSFLCFQGKEINDEKTMEEMDVSDGCVIVQKMSPLVNLLKPDTLTPSVVSSLVKYVENAEILKVKRISTTSLFEKLREMMKKKKENYYPIVTIHTSIAYRHSLSDSDKDELYRPMDNGGIFKILEDECQRVLKSEISEDEEVRKEKDNVVLAYSLIMRWRTIELSLLERIAEYLIKVVLKCVVDSSLLNVGMKASVALYGLSCSLFRSVSFSYSIFFSSFCS
jgi:hypothetical protein